MNVLIFHADQLRQDCLEPYGNKQVITPNISAISEDSVVYTNHFCSYPICTPSRYTFLSGQYAHQHLGWGNHCTIPQGINTFPKILRSNGFNTTAVGKMHFTPTYLDVGFDRMLLAEQDGAGRFDDDYHNELKLAGLIDDIDLIDQRGEFRQHADEEYFDSFGVKASDLPEEYHSTSWITRKALEVVSNWGNSESNLLMVGYIKPHHPFDPPQRFIDMYDADKIEILDGYTDEVPKIDLDLNRGYFDNTSLSKDKLKKMTAYYYASITQIDEGIGEITNLLKEKGLYNDTMIIITSDHGDYLGFHHMALKQNYMYDPLMKIPLIIKYPFSHNALTVNDKLNSNVDISNEILKTCGLQADIMMAKHSLDGEGRRFVFGEQMNYVNNKREYMYMIRSQRYKLLVNKSLEELLFFDIIEDKQELNNLSNKSEYCRQIQEHMLFLLECIAFEGQSGVNLDENAPVIDNSKKSIEKRRTEMMEYFKQKSSVGRYMI